MVVCNEFADDQKRLSDVAHAIALGFKSVLESTQSDEEESEFPEGKVLYRVHKKRERNSKIVKQKKSQATSLACEVCGFDFSTVYGELGEGFIECHHTKPVSEYKPNEKTKLSDLALVCSNCHRMLHRRRPWLGISELRFLASPK